MHRRLAKVCDRVARLASIAGFHGCQVEWHPAAPQQGAVFMKDVAASSKTFAQRLIGCRLRPKAATSLTATKTILQCLIAAGRCLTSTMLSKVIDDAASKCWPNLVPIMT